MKTKIQKMTRVVIVKMKIVMIKKEILIPSSSGIPKVLPKALSKSKRRSLKNQKKRKGSLSWKLK